MKVWEEGASSEIVLDELIPSQDQDAGASFQDFRTVFASSFFI